MRKWDFYRIFVALTVLASDQHYRRLKLKYKRAPYSTFLSHSKFSFGENLKLNIAMNFQSFALLMYSHSILAISDISTKIMKLRYCASEGNCGDIQETVLGTNGGHTWSSSGRDSLAHRRWMAYHRDEPVKIMEKSQISPRMQSRDPILQYLAQKAKTCSVPCQRKSLLIKWV